MSLTPEEELRRAQAWNRFWNIAAEVAAQQAQRDAALGRMLAQGRTREDFNEVDRAIREIDRAMRLLRRTIKDLPTLPSESGCATEVGELRLQMSRLGASWRALKSSWREHDPRAPGAG